MKLKFITRLKIMTMAGITIAFGGPLRSVITSLLVGGGKKHPEDVKKIRKEHYYFHPPEPSLSPI